MTANAPATGSPYSRIEPPRHDGQEDHEAGVEKDRETEQQRGHACRAEQGTGGAGCGTRIFRELGGHRGDAAKASATAPNSSDPAVPITDPAAITLLRIHRRNDRRGGLFHEYDHAA
jgi:hypothetical protein